MSSRRQPEHSGAMRALAGNSHQSSTRSVRNPLPLTLRQLIVLVSLLGLALAPLAHAASPIPHAARGLLLDAALNGHAIVAVGERGAIVRSVDSGETWESLASPTHATLTGIAFANPTIGWVVGHDGVILYTRDGGETWTEQFHAEDRETVFLDVAAIDTARAIAIGAFGVCYTTRDSGRNWLRQHLSEEDNHLNRITHGHDSELFIAGERGTLLRLPAFNKPAERLASPHEASFYGLTPVSTDTLLAYGLRGHIYRSQDDGSSWQRVASPLPALFSNALRLKSGTIILSGQARAFLVSRDAGRTFRAWQPPLTTAVAELLEAPNGLLLAFGEAGVTRLEPPDNNSAPEAPAPLSP
ncbi:WD40/YVTN/BNR-like repeat-containing protein [Nibricoccus aquaticus]|uniref:WD40/YVTN/BNR-like repeat-containing protein n=1 Tax=Nibricoccus aquaticus TaxID=2576891 RepID=UPI0010FD1213|nr:YCF48-related protein [Nibricoccus aquaticus]